MQRGIVEWFNNEKGYGFIKAKDGASIFVHYTQVATDGYKTLIEGEEVLYETLETSKGTQAINVRRNVGGM